MSDLQSHRIDLSSLWQPDPARRSGFARVLGLIRLSRKHLRHRFLESLLIVLGIAIGVGVLTGMESFVRFLLRLDSQYLVSASELRAITIRPRTFNMDEFYLDGGAAAVRISGDLTDPITLTAADLIAARREVPGIGAVSARSGAFGAWITAVDGQPPASSPERAGRLQLYVEGYTPDDLVYWNRELVAGRNMTWEEYVEGAAVLLVEEENLEVVFPGSTADQVIGRTLSTGQFFGTDGTAQGIEWRVIGVLAKPEQPISFFPNDPEVVRGYASHTAGAREAGSIHLTQLNFLPAEGIAPEELVANLEIFFTQRHGEGRVSVTNPSGDLREFTESARRTVLALMGLASLALFVAALNILNLLTATVIRRRRVTAMSVALGAERRSLFARMMTEALLLGVGGSLVGLLIAHGITMFLKAILAAQIDPVLAGQNPLEGLGLGLFDVAVGIAAGVGTSCLFGLYPAYLSASIDPADGLRTE